MERRTTRLLKELASSNNRVAQGVLSNHFYPMLCNLARRKGLSEPDVKDVVQEILLVFIKVFPDKYDKNITGLRCWLAGIAEKVIQNYKRRLLRKRSVVNNGKNTSFWVQIEDEKAAGRTWNTLVSRERLAYILSRARREFSDRDYRVFDLYVLQEKSADYVAKKLGISKVNVHVIICRARRRISAFMQEFKGNS